MQDDVTFLGWWGGELMSARALTVGQKQRVVFSRRGQDLSLYVDGSESCKALDDWYAEIKLNTDLIIPGSKLTLDWAEHMPEEIRQQHITARHGRHSTRSGAQKAQETPAHQETLRMVNG